jgi:hypothetical protein
MNIFDTFDEAIRKANSTDYGFSASFLTRRQPLPPPTNWKLASLVSTALQLELEPLCPEELYEHA